MSILGSKANLLLVLFGLLYSFEETSPSTTDYTEKQEIEKIRLRYCKYVGNRGDLCEDRRRKVPKVDSDGYEKIEDVKDETVIIDFE